MSRAKVLVIGGGPAGSVAALTLNKLGHDVEVYEREVFPRYRIGESFLPGTMSILQRLGLWDKVKETDFVRKPSATFLWGEGQAPWTFSFTTPRVTGWIYDHAIQVKRGEFDQILLNEVAARGVPVHQGTPVRDVDVSSTDHVEITIEDGNGTRTVRGDYLVDASGASSILVKKLGVRRYDGFYRNLAAWSYFRLSDPFTGDLKGTTYSITFKDGWVWMIPVKEDEYSVGIVVDQSCSTEIAEKGLTRFFEEKLARCKGAMKILGDAERIDQVRLVRDWSYDTKVFSQGRFFLSGDAACFTDPLFSQGVHLATQSAVSAAAAIDRLTGHPEEAAGIHRWYEKSYKETFEQYHEFVASFYTYASMTESASEFWEKRRIVESDDERLERREWFHKLVDNVESGAWQVGDFRDRASTMIAIGKHQRMEPSSEFSDSELQLARMKWLGKLNSQLNSIASLRWNGDEVVLHPYYKVNPRTFQLEPKLLLGNEQGRVMTKYAVEPEYGELLDRVRKGELDYKSLVKNLAALGAKETSSQIVIRLFEAGLLAAYDKQGDPVRILDRLRFDGVGVEYEV
jgi:flavin-dependent dehydrogenase